MAAKPQRSIRFDNEAYNGLLRVQLPNENFTATVNRVLLAGVDAIERELRQKPDEAQNEAQANPNETQTGHDDPLTRYIKTLEEHNKYLIAEHEADRAAIAEKDKQIAQALNKSFELAEQANVLARITHEKALPATTTGDEIAVVMDGEQIAQETTDKPTQEQTDEAPEQVETPVEQPKKRSLWERIAGY